MRNMVYLEDGLLVRDELKPKEAQLKTCVGLLKTCAEITDSLVTAIDSGLDDAHRQRLLTAVGLLYGHAGSPYTDIEIRPRTTSLCDPIVFYPGEHQGVTVRLHLPEDSSIPGGKVVMHKSGGLSAHVGTNKDRSEKEKRPERVNIFILNDRDEQVMSVGFIYSTTQSKFMLKKIFIGGVPFRADVRKILVGFGQGGYNFEELFEKFFSQGCELASYVSNPAQAEGRGG